MSGMELLVPLVAGVGSAVASKALAPKPPTPEPVKRMPDPFNTEDAALEKKRVLGRRGRASTLLDEGSDSTSPTYVHDLLGE